MKTPAIDQSGHPVEVGDWVRLVAIPAAVTTAEYETYHIFQLALGKTFRIESFDEFGHAELNVSDKVEKYHWIWVEPECLLLWRRKRSQSLLSKGLS